MIIDEFDGVWPSVSLTAALIDSALPKHNPTLLKHFSVCKRLTTRDLSASAGRGIVPEWITCQERPGGRTTAIAMRGSSPLTGDRHRHLGSRPLETAYDWVTVGIFAALVVLFLQRSVGEERAGDTVWHYLPPAAGCAGANYFGNEGQHVLAILLLVAVAAYTALVLKPFDVRGS
jgi:hypothetical protein